MPFERTVIGNRILERASVALDRFLKRKAQAAYIVETRSVPEFIKTQNIAGFRYIDNIQIDGTSVVLIFEEY